MHHLLTRTYADPPGALACLQQACGPAVLEKLSAAIIKIERSYRYRFFITPTSAADHLAALNACKCQALEFLPVHIGRDEISRGFSSTIAILSYLGSEGVYEEPALDTEAHIRIFKNSLESALLEQGIATRARQRRQDVIQALRAVGEDFYPPSFGPNRSVLL